MARRIGIALAAIAVVVLGAVAYVWFSGGSGEPSTEVTAPPITSAPTTAATTTAADPAATSTVAAESDPTTTVAETAPTAVVESTEPAAAVTTSAVLYRIDKAESSVSFEIDEILNGNPFRVVGVTTEVAGEVLIDFDDPTASQLGTIVINVRTFATDSGFRDRAIRGPILGSSRDENEFA
ncbi:MAG: YceI family protein, partial [bacterium]|nr:YceI family protein [bacterium]